MNLYTKNFKKKISKRQNKNVLFTSTLSSLQCRLRSTCNTELVAHRSARVRTTSTKKHVSFFRSNGDILPRAQVLVGEGMQQYNEKP
jgi:hypothetical protein